ncbi:putative E3 ubiquitin-protein ligase [Lachnellula willkommii]|uniref:RBR-type E3 ubiquitin transferase n=1 Tax=Lachnellula willkommii TaxID=215461 RepID=A0A559M199_9HELO|nr:putative E3 ubiquitin-protein ligase [Lachnellula willkommii]
MAHAHSEMPRYIFGHRPWFYTKDPICQILTHYERRHRKTDLKSTLLEHLVTLEATLADEDLRIIRVWVDQHRSLCLPFTTFFNNANLLEEDSSDDDIPLPKLEGILSPAISVPQATIDCAVCMESLEPESLYQQKITPSCDHETRICASCITQSIDIQIQEISWDMIKCPLCPELMSFESIKEIASEEAFQRYFQSFWSVGHTGANKIRYDRNSVIAAFRHMPNFTYCLNAGCDSGQIHGGGDEQPIMTCTECQFKTCFTHKTAWHSDMTCSEYDEVLAKDKERTKQEAASQKFLAEETKICPNPECGLHCTKVSGCDHMTSSFTRIRADGNTAHSNDCRWHPNQLNA